MFFALWFVLNCLPTSFKLSPFHFRFVIRLQIYFLSMPLDCSRHSHSHGRHQHNTNKYSSIFNSPCRFWHTDFHFSFLFFFVSCPAIYTHSVCNIPSISLDVVFSSFSTKISVIRTNTREKKNALHDFDYIIKSNKKHSTRYGDLEVAEC